MSRDEQANDASNIDITVVSINYNHCDGLRRTILSIQELLRADCSVEHLLVDGQSEDKSQIVAHEYGYGQNISHASLRKKILVKKDGGLWEAMFNGLQNAKGTYVHFVHAGDTFFDSHKISAFYEHLRQHNVDVGVCDVGLLRGNRVKKYFHAGFDPRFISNGLMPPHPGLVIKRSILNEIKAFGDFHRQLPHDFWLCVKLMKRSDLTIYRSEEICIHMEAGGLSSGFSYSLKRIYRQYRILRIEGFRASILRIFIFKIFKICKGVIG